MSFLNPCWLIDPVIGQIHCNNSQCHQRPSSRASLAILKFWLKGGLEDLGDKGGLQMVDHKKMQGVCKF